MDNNELDSNGDKDKAEIVNDVPQELNKSQDDENNDSDGDKDRNLDVNDNTEITPATISNGATENDMEDNERNSSINEWVSPIEESNVLLSNEEVSPSNEEVSLSNGGAPPSNKTVLPSNEEIPPSIEEVPPSNEEIPPSNEEIPPSIEEVLPSNEEILPTNEEVPPSNEEVPPSNEEVSPIKESTVVVLPIEENDEEVVSIMEINEEVVPIEITSSSHPSTNGHSPVDETPPTETKRPHPRQVRFSDTVQRISLVESPPDEHRGLNQASPTATSPTRDSLPGLPQITYEQLVSGVMYQAQYLGSTPIVFSSTQKTVRMQQAKEAVQLIKDPENETQPRIDIDLKISTRDIIIADKKTQVDLMIHPLKTVSYVADIDGCLVVMAHRTIPTSPGQQLKLTCHVLDTADPREVAMVIGQAFSTAYKEFLKTNGVEEKSLDQFEYQHVLKCQSKSEMELNSLKDENKTKEITFAKGKGEILGLMVIDSGYGSAIPTCMIAHMSKTGAAGQSGLLNVGDQILSINGVSLVGLPLKATIEQIKKCRYQTVVKMITCSCSAVVDVTIMRPDLKFQLGFTVKEGNICSLWRGSIAERSGIRVGHRIIEINGTSTVGIRHEEIVHMLSTTVGDLHLRTMPITMYQLLTGQIMPEYF